MTDSERQALLEAHIVSLKLAETHDADLLKAFARGQLNRVTEDAIRVRIAQDDEFAQVVFEALEKYGQGQSDEPGRPGTGAQPNLSVVQGDAGAPSKGQLPSWARVYLPWAAAVAALAFGLWTTSTAGGQISDLRAALKEKSADVDRLSKELTAAQQQSANGRFEQKRVEELMISSINEAYPKGYGDQAGDTTLKLLSPKNTAMSGDVATLQWTAADKQGPFIVTVYDESDNGAVLFENNNVNGTSVKAELKRPVKPTLIRKLRWSVEKQGGAPTSSIFFQVFAPEK